MLYFLYLLAALGLTYGLVNSTLLSRPRTLLLESANSAALESMLSCYACTGFHSGWIIYLFLMPGPFSLRMMLTMAFASAAFCYTGNVVWEYLERTSMTFKIDEGPSNEETPKSE